MPVLTNTLQTQLKSSLLNFALATVPKKYDYVGLTLHNFSPDHYHWATKVITHINHKYGFLDPNNLNFSNPYNVSAPRVLLTFDDGFKSNLHIAKKILNPLEIKAIFFVSSNFIGLSSSASYQFAQHHIYPSRTIDESDGDTTSLSFLDIQYLIETGHVIGAHTANHCSLSSSPLEVK